MDEPVNASADEWGRFLNRQILDQNRGAAALQTLIVANGEEIRRVAANQVIVLDILNGNKNTGLVGLRDRLAAIEIVVEKWHRWEWYAKGLVVGILLNSVISIASLVTILTKVVIPP